MKNKKLLAVGATSLALLGLATNGWCVGTDLLAGVTWGNVADDLSATAQNIITAMIPVLVLMVAIPLAIKVVKRFSR